MDAPNCGIYFVSIQGDTSACGFNDDGSGSDEVCNSICKDGFVSSCKLSGTGVQCNAPCAVDGRRYTVLDDACAPTASDVASYLARMAFFEAASVDSFALLERELAMHEAPAALIRSCTRAKRDEVAHARMARTLARRHGGVIVSPPSLPEMDPRALEAIAIENAVEGCVRETFGVLVGTWQAEHAPTKELRAFFGALAHDESRHAALALRIDAWLTDRLSIEARERVEEARSRALAELEASLDAEPVAGLGLPSVARVKQLFASWTREMSGLGRASSDRLAA
jgi:hypothetical protein